MKNSKKTVLVLGGTGFIGNELGIALVADGYNVRLVSRDLSSSKRLAFPASVYQWIKRDGALIIPDDAMAGVCAIINLAGESIAQGRWTKAKKSRITRSRIVPTEAAATAAQKHGVPTIIQASAIGYYGETSKRIADENSPRGKDFLARVTQSWEHALNIVPHKSRQVIMRLGVVFGSTGGALPEILTPYALGIGAMPGNGSQYMSWVHIKDVCRFVITALKDTSYQGIYNLTAPHPTPFKEIHKVLTTKLGGWPPLRIPELAFKLGLGEKSQMLLASQRVHPNKALKQGFQFCHHKVEKALDDILGSESLAASLFHRKQWVPAKHQDIWKFFSSEKNLEKLTPPWLNFRVVGKSTPQLAEGTTIDYKLRLHGFPVSWQSRIEQFIPEQEFKDIQTSGPYKLWHHTHRFHQLGEGTLIEDYVRYQLPLGIAGRLGGFPLVKKDVENIFRYRIAKTSELFQGETRKIA